MPCCDKSVVYVKLVKKREGRALAWWLSVLRTFMNALTVGCSFATLSDLKPYSPCTNAKAGASGLGTHAHVSSFNVQPVSSASRSSCR